MESIFFFFNLFIIEKRIDIFIYEFSLKTTTLLNMFLLDVNFDKSIIKLYFLLIFFMLAKFLENKKSVVMSSIKCLNLKFL